MKAINAGQKWPKIQNDQNDSLREILWVFLLFFIEVYVACIDSLIDIKIESER